MKRTAARRLARTINSQASAYRALVLTVDNYHGRPETTREFIVMTSVGTFGSPAQWQARRQVGDLPSSAG
jgi:hypothetical protein